MRTTRLGFIGKYKTQIEASTVESVGDNIITNSKFHHFLCRLHAASLSPRAAVPSLVVIVRHFDISMCVLMEDENINESTCRSGDIGLRWGTHHLESISNASWTSLAANAISPLDVRCVYAIKKSKHNHNHHIFVGRKLLHTYLNSLWTPLTHHRSLTTFRGSALFGIWKRALCSIQFQIYIKCLIIYVGVVSQERIMRKSRNLI